MYVSPFVNMCLCVLSVCALIFLQPCNGVCVCVCVDEGLVEGWAKPYNGQLKRTILLFSN